MVENRHKLKWVSGSSLKYQFYTIKIQESPFDIFYLTLEEEKKKQPHLRLPHWHHCLLWNSGTQSSPSSLASPSWEVFKQSSCCLGALVKPASSHKKCCNSNGLTHASNYIVFGVELDELSPDQPWENHRSRCLKQLREPLALLFERGVNLM